MGIKVNGIQIAGVGAPGKSAYEAAKEAGYTGTEQEFNALFYIIGAHASRHEIGGADALDLSKLAGTLPPEKGGTGVSSLDELKESMGATAVEDIGNLHVWAKAPYEQIAVRSSESEELLFSNSSLPFVYSSAPPVVVDGVLTLQNTKTISSVSNWGNFVTEISGMYFTCQGYPGRVFYYAGKTTANTRCTAYEYTIGYAVGDLEGYVTSADVTAYPDGDVVDGYHYTYLGQIGAGIEPGVKIEVGSYVGTGTYGGSNPCSITAPFEIKAVGIISACDSKNAMFPLNSSVGQFWLSALQLTTSYKSNCGLVYNDNDFSNSYAKKSADGKTVYWYNIRSASVQLNYSGDIHYYIAIG